MESIFRDLADMWEEFTRHKSRARGIQFTFSVGPYRIRGNDMTFSMVANSPGALVHGSPLNGLTPPGPSTAVLSNQVFTSSDTAVFSVAPNPAVPGDAIIKPVGSPAFGTQLTATLTETALATEPDGITTEKIQGVSTIVITAVPPPPPPPAASIALTFTPIVVPPPPPPPAV